MPKQKIDRTELDSPCRELSNGGLESVVNLLVRWQINYSCASAGKAIQLYGRASVLCQNLSLPKSLKLLRRYHKLKYFTMSKTCSTFA